MGHSVLKYYGDQEEATKPPKDGVSVTSTTSLFDVITKPTGTALSGVEGDSDPFFFRRLVVFVRALLSVSNTSCEAVALSAAVTDIVTVAVISNFFFIGVPVLFHLKFYVMMCVIDA